MEETSEDKAFSVVEVQSRIEELKRFSDLMEPVVIPQSFLDIPGIRLLKLGKTKLQLTNSLKHAEDLLRELESPPTRLIVKRALEFFRSLHKPPFTDKDFEVIQSAYDNQKKHTKDGIEEEPAALAFWELYQLKLPTVIMKDLDAANPKKPLGLDWSKKSYRPDNPEIKRWCERCGNIGVNVGYGGIVVLDEDIFNAFDESGIWDILPHGIPQVETGKGNHYYYDIGSEEIAKKLVKTLKQQGGLYNKLGEHIGDFKVYQSNVVAPGSLHPSGKPYKLVKDGPLVKVSEEQILSALRLLAKPEVSSCGSACRPAAPYDSSSSHVQPEWQANISCMELLLKLFPDWKTTISNGGFDKGIHPLHGSESGENFGINTDTNTFRCYRDEVSGGPVELYAVLTGLMPCTPLANWKREYPNEYFAALVGLHDMGYEVPLDPRPLVWYRKSDIFTLKTATILTGIEELYQRDPYNPPLLMSGGALQRVQRVATRRGGKVEVVALPQKLNAGALRGLLNRALKVMVESKVKGSKKGETITQETGIEEDVITDILNVDQPQGVPLLTGLSEYPLFNADGSLLDTPGYDPNSGMFYMPPPGFQLEERPRQPTREDAKAAAQYIFDEVLEGFKWEHEDGSDAVNALALLLSPLIRPMIAGPMPLCLVNKRKPQTGGSKLCQIPSLILTGHPAFQFSPITGEDEFRKKITTILAKLPEIVILDNADQQFPVQTFCSLLTANVWSDRILGGNDIFTHEHTVCWIANGNNLVAKRELVVRSYIIGLDAGTAHPEARTDFKHPNNEFEVWIRDNRHILLSKLILIVEAWLAAGKPAATKYFGVSSGFYDAISTLAAICDFALPDSMPGFNANAAGNAKDIEDSTTSAHADFLRSWGMLWGDKKVSVKEFKDEAVFSHFDERDMPEELVYENSYGQRSFVGRTKLNAALKKMSKNRFESDDLYIKFERDEHARKDLYYMPQGAAYFMPGSKELEKTIILKPEHERII